MSCNWINAVFVVIEMFVANREDSKEAQYLLRSLSSYIFDIHGDDSNIMVTDTHPLVIEDHNKFDKVIFILFGYSIVLVLL